MKQVFLFGDRSYELDLAASGDGYRVHFEGRDLEAAVRDLGEGRLEVTLDGRSVVVYTASNGEKRWASLDGRTYELQLEKVRRGSRGGEGQSSSGTLRAPMPGQVREVRVLEGEEVSAGQVLLLLEAMKMEIRIQSPVDGTITALHVAAGEQVDKDQALVEVR